VYFFASSRILWLRIAASAELMQVDFRNTKKKRKKISKNKERFTSVRVSVAKKFIVSIYFV
jgi:hypothetical protein